MTGMAALVETLELVDGGMDPGDAADLVLGTFDPNDEPHQEEIIAADLAATAA